jgi:hypothetical protein
MTSKPDSTAALRQCYPTVQLAVRAYSIPENLIFDRHAGNIKININHLPSPYCIPHHGFGAGFLVGQLRLGLSHVVHCQWNHFSRFLHPLLDGIATSGALTKFRGKYRRIYMPRTFLVSVPEEFAPR